MNFNAIFKNSLPYGLILGGILVVLSLLMYITDVNMFSLWFSILNFLVLLIGLPVTMVIIGTNNLRVKLMPDRKINYLQALLSCFIILFIGFFISVLYSYIFNNWIDPEYMKNNIEKFKEMMEGYNVPPEKIEEQAARIEGNTGIARQIFTSAGICVVISLILALIVRKKDKEADNIY
ncbi:MAG: DUF4199 domain-containing protein [Bacteroidetes bacterium]|nr:DUF4199 domain-containing protein [Bacteroidota bacterium]